MFSHFFPLAAALAIMFARIMGRGEPIPLAVPHQHPACTPIYDGDANDVREKTAFGLTGPAVWNSLPASTQASTTNTAPF